MDIDMTLSFWLTTLVILVGPFIKPVVGVLEHRIQILSRKFGQKASFNLYSCCSFFYSVFTYVCYLQTLHFQHNSYKLQTNQALLFGYTLLIGGLTLKVISFVSHGWTVIIGGYYFHPCYNEDGKGSEGKPENDPYYHPSGTSSILIMIGLSFIMASETGLLMCLVLGLAYACAYQLEQFLLCVPKMNFLSEIHLPKFGLDVIQTFNVLHNSVKRKWYYKDSDKIDG